MISNIRYEEAIVIYASSFNERQHMINHIVAHFESFGLYINIKDKGNRIFQQEK